MKVSKTAINVALATLITTTAGVAVAGSCGGYSKGWGYGPGMGYGGAYARPSMAPPRPMRPQRPKMGRYGQMAGPYAGGYPMAPQTAAPMVGAAIAADGNAEPAASASVSIAQMRFAAPTVTVKAGSTVTWTNNEGMSHTVTAEDGSFGSEQLGMGGTFSRTFAEPGTYNYYCKLHPNMRGKVVVAG